MKILIADDDPITLDTLAACLNADGYATITARDGREALACWRTQRPDLCCLDIMMPDIDGYEVCRTIRQEDARIPVIFLSAKSEEIDVVVGLKLGADDFIRKPFGKHELLARIATALRRARATSPTPSPSFSMNSLKIFPQELRAERAGKSIDLSPRETAILKVLHRQAGQVVTRDMLLNECWGLDYYPESRTLDQHISKLRKRIEDPSGPTELIETIRGVGYRFRPA